ncbi:MAG: (2Fe-2S) ferredoxin domain-containing protein [Cyanobacteria bacterium J06632_3]
MKVLQGKYVGQIMSDKGRLKGIQLDTDDGKLQIELPKSLRAIAQQELVVGESLRVWSTASQKSQSKSPKLSAVQLIPMSPKPKIVGGNQPVQEVVDKNPANKNPADSLLSRQKTAKDKKNKAKTKAAKKQKSKLSGLTVQLCQKKNCCRRGGDDLWKAFEAAQQTVSAQGEKPFKLKAAGCLGGCKRGPNLRVLPDNVKHYHVRPKEIKALLRKHGA